MSKSFWHKDGFIFMETVLVHRYLWTDWLVGIRLVVRRLTDGLLYQKKWTYWPLVQMGKEPGFWVWWGSGKKVDQLENLKKKAKIQAKKKKEKKVPSLGSAYSRSVTGGCMYEVHKNNSSAIVYPIAKLGGGGVSLRNLHSPPAYQVILKWQLTSLIVLYMYVRKLKYSATYVGWWAKLVSSFNYVNQKIWLWIIPIRYLSKSIWYVSCKNNERGELIVC